MHIISFNEFHSMVGAVEAANQARNAGDEAGVQVALADAATVFDSVGLAGVVAVRDLRYADSNRFQLCGAGEKGISYEITQKGIVFP